jgi:hypothetical protein
MDAGGGLFAFCSLQHSPPGTKGCQAEQENPGIGAKEKTAGIKAMQPWEARFHGRDHLWHRHSTPPQCSVGTDRYSGCRKLDRSSKHSRFRVEVKKFELGDTLEEQSASACR